VLIQKSNIEVTGLPKALVLDALMLCRGSNRTSFPDALLCAEARNAPGSRVLTFDRRFPSEGIAVEQLGSDT
jgi:predicted nucleic-acid-binding protein